MQTTRVNAFPNEQQPVFLDANDTTSPRPNTASTTQLRSDLSHLNQLQTSLTHHAVVDALPDATIPRAIQDPTAPSTLQPTDLRRDLMQLAIPAPIPSAADTATQSTDEIANHALTAAVTPRHLTLSPISSQDELIDFLQSLDINADYGVSTQGDTTVDDRGQKATLYTYQGLVFRLDTRFPDDIFGPGKSGFNVKPGVDLTDPAQLQQAQGLKTKDSLGATEIYGISSAKQMNGSLVYCADKSNLYLINTAKLSSSEKAYDIGAILLKNKYYEQVDASGGEVNCTNIPPQAIIGCILDVNPAILDADPKILDATPEILDADTKKNNNTQAHKLLKHLRDHRDNVQFNQLYNSQPPNADPNPS